MHSNAHPFGYVWWKSSDGPHRLVWPRLTPRSPAPAQLQALAMTRRGRSAKASSHGHIVGATGQDQACFARVEPQQDHPHLRAGIDFLRGEARHQLAF
jgi:hypothetical protein